MVSMWEQYSFEATITEILLEIRPIPPEHHFGRPFLSAYQLAIEFALRSPTAVEALCYQIGGEGTGQRNSLAQYIARELSGRINDGRISHIEGGFLSHLHLNDISFRSNGEMIRSSLTSAQFDLSMFRLRSDPRS